MDILKTIQDMQAWSTTQRRAGKRIGVVPTMGFLHDGHLSLIDTAKSNADVVIVTIFVNPTQFAPTEDLDQYPRDFERDQQLCEEHGASAIFAPEPAEMYPENATTWVTEEALTKGLCGRSRPTHFRGVTTIVTKLFNATLPDVAVFGQKDAQQALVLKRMTRDLNFPIEIIIAPLVREADGLAMSSRNSYLSADERLRALSINRSLHQAQKAIEHGEDNTTIIKKTIQDQITENGGKIDYVEIVGADDVTELDKIDRQALIAVAAYFGNTRLIDNIVVDRP